VFKQVLRVLCDPEIPACNPSIDKGLRQKISDRQFILKGMNSMEAINLERLAYILKSLSPAEFETLEILLDEDAFENITQSLEELDAGERIPIDEW